MEKSNLQPSIVPEGQPPTSGSQTALPNQPPLPPFHHLPSLWEKYLPLFLAIGGIVVGIGIFFLIKGFVKMPTQTPPITVIVTPTASPTPARYPTNISTTSAFLEFETSLASFSSQLGEFAKEDSSLSPPTLVLPLGFSNQ